MRICSTRNIMRTPAYDCHLLGGLAYSNKKITNVDDLLGMKVRAGGVRGEVLTEMGASVVVCLVVKWSLPWSVA